LVEIIKGEIRGKPFWVPNYVKKDRSHTTQTSDAKGVNTSMTYDTHGNLLTRQQSGFSGATAITATTQYTYNAYGQITAIDGPRTDVNDTVSFAYCPNEAGQTTSFTYDAMNRPVSQSYSGTGGDILFAYDQGGHAVGHLSQITDREGMDAFAYDSAGRIARGNGDVADI
jgi:YD repeat-containing protein